MTDKLPFPKSGDLTCIKCRNMMEIVNLARYGKEITTLYWRCRTCGWGVFTETADADGAGGA